MLSPRSLSFCHLPASFRPLIIGYSSTNLRVRPWTNSNSSESSRSQFTESQAPQLDYVWLRFSVLHSICCSFETLCPVFQTSNTTEYNGGLYFRPGNYQGQNTDSMSFTCFDRKELTVMVHTWLIVAQALVFCVSLIISASQLIWYEKLVDSRSTRHTSTAPIIAFTLSPLSSLPPSADRPPEGAIIHRRSNAVGT